MRAGLRWCLVGVGAVACKSGDAPSTTPPEAAVAAEPAAVEPSEPPKPQEPESPWPITLVDAKGHAPRLDGPRPIVWVTMSGLAATSGAGEPEKLVAFVDGRPERAGKSELIPELYELLNEHEHKGVLEVWADERVPADTVIRVLYSSGRAGFVEWDFVVGKPGARELVRLVPTRYNPSAEASAPQGPAWADLELAWGSAGVHASLVSRWSETEDLPPRSTVALDLGGADCIVPGGTRPDASALRPVLEGLCASAEGKRFALRVRLDDAEQIGDVLWAVANDPRPESCRLPSVIEAGNPGTRRSCEGARPMGDAIAALQPGAGRKASGGAGFGGRGEAVPSVRQAKAMVKGPLDADLVRRIVRAHINEVRSCYSKGLAVDPELAGTVVVGFGITKAGKVGGADVVSSTLKDEAVGKCIAAAVKRWTFPKPDGGEVLVEYPFVLAPG